MLRLPSRRAPRFGEQFLSLGGRSFSSDSKSGHLRWASAPEVSDFTELTSHETNWDFKRLAGSHRFFAALVCAMLFMTGCGYRIAGHANTLPTTIKTIAVPSFANHTVNYRIEDRLTNAVVHEFLARTSYHIVPNPADADAVLRGEVDAIGNSAEVFDPATGRATTILVTVTMKVRLEDRATGNVLYHNDNFVFREPYEISTDVKTFFEEESPALDRLSRDFGARVVADVLEQF